MVSVGSICKNELDQLGIVTHVSPNLVRVPHKGMSIDVDRHGKIWESKDPRIIGHVTTIETAYNRVAMFRELVRDVQR